MTLEPKTRRTPHDAASGPRPDAGGSAAKAASPAARFRGAPAHAAARLLLCLLLALAFALPAAGCSEEGGSATAERTEAGGSLAAEAPDAGESETASDVSQRPPEEAVAGIPEYSGLSYVELNGNVPYFDGEADLPEGYESYAPLDVLGRCGTAEACVGEETMPSGERGDISGVRPSGWSQEFYDFVDNEALYNRSHLIGWQLSGEDANERNLITGTRHMNVDVMEPLESAIARYVRKSGNHVRYRVTPVFSGEEEVARGVLMEAESVEDGGAGVSFCVFAYNVQPGVDIDYRTGANWANGQSTATDSLDADEVVGARGTGGSGGAAEAGARADASGAKDGESAADAEERDYVLNANTRRFHDPSCPSVEKIAPGNREDFHGTRDALVEDGWKPCGSCRP